MAPLCGAEEKNENKIPISDGPYSVYLVFSAINN